MRMRDRINSQTIGMVNLTRGHIAGKKKKEDNPLVARDISQIVQAVVNLLQILHHIAVTTKIMD